MGAPKKPKPPKAPEAPPIPPPERPIDDAVTGARRDRRRAAAAARPFGGTLLTGGQGVPSGGLVGRSRLLGGG